MKTLCMFPLKISSWNSKRNCVVDFFTVCIKPCCEGEKRGKNIPKGVWKHNSLKEFLSQNKERILAGFVPWNQQLVLNLNSKQALQFSFCLFAQRNSISTSFFLWRRGENDSFCRFSFEAVCCSAFADNVTDYVHFLIL